MNAETAGTAAGTTTTTIDDGGILSYHPPVEPKSDIIVFWVLAGFGFMIVSALLGMLAWVGAFSQHL